MKSTASEILKALAQLSELQTGTIILVSGTAPLARKIQRFQRLSDEPSGEWNHSAILVKTPHNIYVAEESQIEGRKVKAAAILTPITKYLEGDYKLLALVPEQPIAEAIMEEIIFKHIGIPYDYRSTFHDEIIRTLHDVWVGKGHARGWRRMNCHEFVQYVWHVYRPEAFQEYFKGDVSEAFYYYRFTHDRIK